MLLFGNTAINNTVGFLNDVAVLHPLPCPVKPDRQKYRGISEQTFFPGMQAPVRAKNCGFNAHFFKILLFPARTALHYMHIINHTERIMPKNVFNVFIILLLFHATCTSQAASSSDPNAAKGALGKENLRSPYRQQHESLLYDEFIDDDGDDDRIYMSNTDENEIIRDILRENATLSGLFDHTDMTTYDKSEWIFIGVLVGLFPMLVGLICAYSHR